MSNMKFKSIICILFFANVSSITDISEEKKVIDVGSADSVTKQRKIEEDDTKLIEVVNEIFVRQLNFRHKVRFLLVVLLCVVRLKNNEEFK